MKNYYLMVMTVLWLLYRSAPAAPNDADRAGGTLRPGDPPTVAIDPARKIGRFTSGFG